MNSGPLRTVHAPNHSHFFSPAYSGAVTPCDFPSVLFCFFKVLNSRSSDLNVQPASGDLTLSFEFFMLLTLPLPHSYLSSSHASCLSGIPLYLDSSETLRDDVSGGSLIPVVLPVSSLSAVVPVFAVAL